MLKALETIVSFLKTILGFIVLIINHIIQFIVNLPNYLNFVLSLFNLIPPFVRWFCIAAAIYIAIETIVQKIRGAQ